jgi:hypothetical protein
MYNRMKNYQYGNFLLVDEYTKRNKIEIKRLTQSSQAVEVRDIKANWDDAYFIKMIKEGFRVTGKFDDYSKFRMYRVDDNASSILYALKDDFIASLSFTEEKFNQLELAIELLYGIKNSKGNVQFWQSSHDRLIKQFENTKVPHSYDMTTLDLSLAIEHDRVYGNQLVEQATNDIKGYMKNSW